MGKECLVNSVEFAVVALDHVTPRGLVGFAVVGAPVLKRVFKYLSKSRFKLSSNNVSNLDSELA